MLIAVTGYAKVGVTNCNFSIDHWCEVIQSALNLGYHFYSFGDWIEGSPTAERTIILRHDIDVSLEMAMRLARIEAGLGIRATYFIRLHSKLYNPQEPESLANLSELSKLNVEIGLHYERQVYKAKGGNYTEMLARDAQLLSNILGKPITGCGGHRVGTFPSLDELVVKSAGFLYDAYAPEFVKERKYISDSAGHWREGCLCQWLGRVNHLTVLTHPVWWFESARMKDQILERIRNGD